MLNAAAIYAEAARAGWTPDPDLTIDEWADATVMLSAKGSPEPGRYRTARTPYAREPMRLLSPQSRCRRVALMWAAQTSKTQLGLNFAGFVVDKAPGPMLFVQPTVDIAKRYSKQRLQSMIEETPALREKIKPRRERDSGNTLLAKEFEGGIILGTGANSAAGLRSMPIRFLHCDEVDAWPHDVEGEGDPVELAEKRTTTFNRRKILLTSTPTLKGASRIEHEFERSDQRRYFVPCPHCNEYQWLKWGGKDTAHGIKWESGKPKTAHYVCEHCGKKIEEKHKTWMLERGQWRATAEGDGETAGFHLSALYSPIGWKSWEEVVREWLKAQGNPERLKTFVNTVLAETWEDEYAAKVGADALRDRCEAYTVGTVPRGGLVLVAGIDVQGNRIAVKVKAYAENEESWLVSYQEIYGDPDRITGTAEQPSVWDQVGNLLDAGYEHEAGGKLFPRVAAVDSGDNTHAVYTWVRHRLALFNAGRSKCLPVAVKGASKPGKPVIGKPTKQDVDWKGQIIKGGVELYLVGTDSAKSTVYGRLKLVGDGPGCMHFPVGCEANVPDYFEQLTAERAVFKYARGFQTKVWEKAIGARNEALDCEVYAFAALQVLLTRTNRLTVWQQLRDNVARAALAAIPGTAPPPPAAPARKMRSAGVTRR